jgi:hypothetical protein
MKTRVLPSLVLAVLLAPRPAEAVWYAVPTPDGGVAQCVQAEDSIDDAWKHVEAGWAQASGQPKATCKLNREGAAGMVGFLFDCGEGGDHFFFRTGENCHTFMKIMNSKTPFKVEDFAPKGLVNPNAWVPSLTACMNTLVKPETMAQVGLQAISSVCECQATKVANTKGQSPADAAPEAFLACLRAAPAPVGKKLLDGYKVSLGASAGPAPAAAQPK